jgi:hypothetical protein
MMPTEIMPCPVSMTGRAVRGRGSGIEMMPCQDHGRHDLPRFDDVVNRQGDPEVLPDVVSTGSLPPGESSNGTYFQDMGRRTGPAWKSRRGSEAGRPEKGGREFFRPPRVELERKDGTR